ncbi:hypothetical protein QBC46DRAFT_412162 [Diplogelasinospora grovesii]|uniref:Uncharacterized protein n=1 Tax=Diplogelasinospora grovesii TaxID=303347 RepID=A0AAN6N0I4_9PEZI|nr:hypothetical protein QBC46DRAFT_412162 [Diplogelasinospora grovesii]
MIKLCKAYLSSPCQVVFPRTIFSEEAQHKLQRIPSRVDMDPVMAIQVASAVAGFADMATRLSKRIYNFTSGSVELPTELRDISTRLNLLHKCLDLITSRLQPGDNDEERLRMELLRYITARSTAKYASVFWVESADPVTVSKGFGAIADELCPGQALRIPIRECDSSGQP